MNVEFLVLQINLLVLLVQNAPTKLVLSNAAALTALQEMHTVRDAP